MADPWETFNEKAHFVKHHEPRKSVHRIPDMMLAVPNVSLRTLDDYSRWFAIFPPIPRLSEGST